MTGVKALAFTISYGDALSLWHDVDEVRRIVAAGTNVELVADLITKVVGESCVRQSMFSVASILAGRVHY